MDGAQAHFPGHQQQDDGQRHAALMQSLMQAAAAGMGQPMMQMGMARPPGMPGQQGWPMQQVSHRPNASMAILVSILCSACRRLVCQRPEACKITMKILHAC